MDLTPVANTLLAAHRRDSVVPGRSCRDRPRGRRRTGCRNEVRDGFTVLELLTTICIISILAALFLPAVSASREAARRLQCRNNLKGIGLALHSYHDDYHCLPAGLQWQSFGQTAYGWAVPLLPLLEQRPVYALVNRNAALGAPVNTKARQSTLPAVLCPSDIAQLRFELFVERNARAGDVPLVQLPTANYLGIFGTIEPDNVIPPPVGDGGFIEGRPVRFSELLRGLSNTIIVGERTMARVPSTWLGVDFRGADAACRLLGYADKGPNRNDSDECEFDSRHLGSANFLWGDGHVKSIGNSIDSQVYRDLARRSEF